MKIGHNFIKKANKFTNTKFKIILKSKWNCKVNLLNFIMIVTKKIKPDLYLLFMMKQNLIRLRNHHKVIKEVGENTCKVSLIKKLTDF